MEDFTHLGTETTKEKLKEQKSCSRTESKNGLTVIKAKGTAVEGWEWRDKGRGHCLACVIWGSTG